VACGWRRKSATRQTKNACTPAGKYRGAKGAPAVGDCQQALVATVRSAELALAAVGSSVFTTAGVAAGVVGLSAMASGRCGASSDPTTINTVTASATPLAINSQVVLICPRRRGQRALHPRGAQLSTAVRGRA
jgi:hypothetical protein